MALAPYACHPASSRGRMVAEEESTFRSPFHRDRDRIIHASAFRRLKHKTQVFVEHEGDYYRTRLTHSIEVAQVARTIAGALSLNAELTEAIALAHDLGHTPFGHTGEDALDALMQPYGGFDHNAQTIRIVTRLERHYAAFDGLNLTWETLEGIAKHNGPVPEPLPYGLAEYALVQDLELHTHASAEAQAAAIADDIAYNNHDLHDGVRAGLFTDQEIEDLPLVGPAYAQVDHAWPGLDATRRRHEALRRVFGAMVTDVIDTARSVLEGPTEDAAGDTSGHRLRLTNPARVRAFGRPVVAFSPGLHADVNEIRRFLFTRMYRADRVMQVRAQVTRVIEDLFALYMATPRHLPEAWRAEVAEAAAPQDLARLVADYIAGMTDRFALQQHADLCGGDALDRLR